MEKKSPIFDIDKNPQLPIEALSESQLALVGGGIGETIL
jgi:hypothetical protein